MTGAAVQSPSGIWSMAGLPGSSAMVFVPPPLLCKPSVSNNGSVLESEPPAVKPQEEPESML